MMDGYSAQSEVARFWCFYRFAEAAVETGGGSGLCSLFEASRASSFVHLCTSPLGTSLFSGDLKRRLGRAFLGRSNVETKRTGSMECCDLVVSAWCGVCRFIQSQTQTREPHYVSCRNELSQLWGGGSSGSGGISSTAC